MGPNTTGGTNTTMSTETKKCHGCCGKGWIENSRGDLKLCPVCNGSGITKTDETHIKWYPCNPYYPFNPYQEQYPLVTYCDATTQSNDVATSLTTRKKT